MIRQIVRLTGVPSEIVRVDIGKSSKRKCIFPPSKNKGLKIQRSGDDGSPILSIKTGMTTDSVTQPGVGNPSRPAVGRVKKGRKRKIITPKHSYTPTVKQHLLHLCLILGTEGQRSNMWRTRMLFRRRWLSLRLFYLTTHIWSV